jgi:Peptidase family M28
MKIIFSLIFLSFSLLAFSGEKDTVAIKYANTITKEDLSKHLHVLASDEYGGRETGKKSLNMAADYISNFYKTIGIKPLEEDSYYQTYKIGLQAADGVSIAANGKEFKFKEDFILFPSYLKNEKINSEVIFLGYGIESENYSDYANIDVKGKIVIVLDGEPKSKKGIYYVTGTDKKSKWSNFRMELKTEAAKEKGALAILIIDENVADNVKSFGHYLESEKMKVLTGEIEYNYPKFYITPELAEIIIGKPVETIQKKINSKGKPVTMNLENKLSINIDKKTSINDADNVLAYVEGSDKKEELIVVSAHYDHIGIQDGKVYNGADDDGSGTVAVMEMAEAFHKAKVDGNGPRRSILFLNVSGEEKGLLGSKYYAENPVFPLEKTVADLNIDMIGRLDKAHADDENYVYIIGSNMLSTQLHNINENANATYSDLDLDYTYNDKDDPNRYYYRSDHYNFAKNGIPVIFYFNGVHADYHKHTDTVDKIIFTKMEKITRLVFHTAWELVNREERIKMNEVTE